VRANSYLYGKDEEVPEIPDYIIMRRIGLLKDMLNELLEVPLLQRDTDRYNAVIKAIDFWENINEC